LPATSPRPPEHRAPGRTPSAEWCYPSPAGTGFGRRNGETDSRPPGSVSPVRRATSTKPRGEGVPGSLPRKILQRHRSEVGVVAIRSMAHLEKGPGRRPRRLRRRVPEGYNLHLRLCDGEKHSVPLRERYAEPRLHAHARTATDPHPHPAADRLRRVLLPARFGVVAV